MTTLARWCVRHRLVVLAIWIAVFGSLLTLSISLGTDYRDSFNLKGAESAKAYELLTRGTGQPPETDSVVFHTRQPGDTIAAHAADIAQVVAELAQVPSVTGVDSPFDPSFAFQNSPTGTIAYASIHFDNSPMKLDRKNIELVVATAKKHESNSLQIELGGRAIAMLNQPETNVGEQIGIVAAAIILLLAFGSFMAMLLPIGVALFALGTAGALVGLMTHVLTIATFAPQLGSLIGLGVGIDYALFIVTRHRQGLLRGLDVDTAATTAVNTSGRAVLFAGSTVCVALLGMLVLRISFLNGVAIAASLTVLVTMVAAVTLLPALLRLQGMRVLSRRQRRQLAEHGPRDDGHHPQWERWSNFVARRPVWLSIGAVAVVAVLIVPYFSLHLGNADQGSDPPTSTTRKAYDLLSAGFGPGSNGPLQIVAEVASPSDRALLYRVGTTLATTPGIAAVAPCPTASTDVACLIVIPTTSPSSVETSQLITNLRTSILPTLTKGEITTYVGGVTAIFDDFAETIKQKLPLFIGVIVLLGCLLLLIAFRSLVIPLTAAVMNLLAAGASFGFVVAIFQWGWGESLLNVGKGPIESFLPVMMVAILFGLSMDYQVFLVSRMHEEWVHTKDNRLAVVRGQTDTGRVITAAGLIMISVFFAFVFGGQRVIAEFGMGLGIAVLIDAFLLRTILVPALMHLFGNANWWLPASIDRVMPHLAVEAPDDPTDS
ncbi:MAG: MMPL family transporter [Acidobacteria bacterium]|nr:MMPL family transporter [Acidobacteriota bacterium]